VEQVLIFPSLLPLHQFSCNGFQQQTSPFLWIPSLFQLLSYSKSEVNSQQTQLELKSKSWYPIICNFPVKSKVEVILWPTVSRPVCRGVRPPSEICGKFYFSSFLELSSVAEVTLRFRSSKLLYDWRSVSQYILVSSALVGLATRYYFLAECCCLKFAALFLWGVLSHERTGL
jgi:hypothetical protein